MRILIWERASDPRNLGHGHVRRGGRGRRVRWRGTHVDVVAPGGAQHVEWTDEGIWLTGWAEVIAESNGGQQ